MPMIRRCDGNDIDIFIFQKFSNVRVTLDIFAARFGSIDAVFEHVFINITKRNQTHPTDGAESGDVIGAASMKTNDSNTNVAVRAEDAFVNGKCESAGG